ncbi:FeoA family protein [Sporolactobacillus sp. Y61]|jgi:ferrous iron transport protein A|uniref:FeoA family protein n=2 Tax=unclassified Sporolactobacillus TaxID=2628533 RepID=A0AAU8IDQ9_9BACL
MVMFLADLKPGMEAKIIDLSKINQVARRRLMDLGVSEGEVVCCKALLPFGGPCMFETCGQCVGIRLNEARSIFVECEQS